MERKDNIFIIDKKYDFPELEQRLKKDMIKKEAAMVLTLQAVTEKTINEKKKVFEGRIWKTALLAAFAPRANDADIIILKKEKEFYVALFNLDEESLKHDAEMANIKDDQLAEFFEIKTTEENESLEQCYVDEFVKRFPFLPIGNHTCIKKYRLGTQFLQDSLNSVVERAMEVNSMEVNRKQIQQDSLNGVVERAMEINHREVNQKLDSGIAEKCTDLDWYLLHVLVGNR